jgi:hypothetical protein
MRYQLQVRLSVVDRLAVEPERSSFELRFDLGRGSAPAPIDLARIEVDVHNAILDLVSKRRTYELPDVDGCGIRIESSGGG